MNRHERQLQTIFGGRSDANIRFSETGQAASPDIPENTIGKGTLMYKYEIILYWNNEDSAFVAEVPELPGCMAHGDSQNDALKNVNEAMHLWIGTAREFGDPIPRQKGERLMYA